MSWQSAGTASKVLVAGRSGVIAQNIEFQRQNRLELSIWKGRMTGVLNGQPVVLPRVLDEAAGGEIVLAMGSLQGLQCSAFRITRMELRQLNGEPE